MHLPRHPPQPGLATGAHSQRPLAAAGCGSAGCALAPCTHARTHRAHPTGQALCTAKHAHVRTNLHQQHGSPLLVDARQGLQQPQLWLPGLQALQQVLVHAGDALPDLLNVLHDLLGHKAVHCAELLGAQGLAQFLPARSQPPLVVQHLVHGLSLDQGFDHGTRALSVDVGHQHVDADARIHQHLVQPVLLGAAHAHQLLPLARYQAKLAHLHRWDERGAQQTRTRQRGQPLRIGHVGLATGHSLDMPRVDHPSNKAHRLQRRKRAFPIHPCALHHHDLRGHLQRPLRQGAAVAFEGAEVSLGDLYPAIVMFDNGAGRDLGLVNVQRNDALVHRGQIHCGSPAA